MRRTTAVAIVGLLLLAGMAAGCGAVSIAAQKGTIPETLVRFPPNARYQFILRIGSDGRHWGGDRTPRLALNIWVHGRGTSWHVMKLLRVPLGERAQQ